MAARRSSMAHAAMKNTQENGPGQAGLAAQPARPGPARAARQRKRDQPDIQPASDGDGDCSGTSGGMDTMFDRLRDAAAQHDDDCDLLPLIQDGAATGIQPER